MDEAAGVVGMLREHGFRITPQRHAIIQEVLRASGHILPQDVTRRVQRRLPAVNASTVYRTLATLEEVGVLRHAHLERGAEYHRTGDVEHVHLTCSSCGAEDDLGLREAESLKRLVERASGYTPDLTHFAISGLCARCRRSSNGRRRTGDATRRRAPAGRSPSRARTGSRGRG